MARRYVVTVYDGTTELYRKEILTSKISEDQLKALLMALVARRGLDDDEIVSSYLNVGSEGYTAHLEVTHDQRANHWNCGGGGINAVVRIVDN